MPHRYVFTVNIVYIHKSEMINPELKNKVAIVTGGNSGIGASISKALAEQRASVVIHYLNPDKSTFESDKDYSIEHNLDGEPLAKEVVNSIRNSGGEAASISGDLNSPETITRLFDFAEKEFGPVEILVNNAAHCELPDTIKKSTRGSIERHFKVNVEAAVLLIKELATRLEKEKNVAGRIINISTDTAQTFATQISYGASKAAIEAYTRSIAIELGPDNITVNCIAPGPIQTGWIDSELEKQVLPSIPLGRVGYPEDIADCVVFLASKQARWITGQIIKVSGGHAL